MALQRLLWAVFATALFLSPARAAMDAGDLICESSTTTGTGTLNLAGALTNYVTFVSQITSGSVVPYHIIASDGTLEAGYGVYTDAGTDTLTRVASWSTDGSGAELTLPAGTHSVCVGPTAALFFNGAGLSTPHTGMDFQLDSDGTPLTPLSLGIDSGFSVSSLTASYTSEGALGVTLWLGQETTTPATSDRVGQLKFYSYDNAANPVDYAQIFSTIIDTTNGSEDGTLGFTVIAGGADLTALTLGGAGNISTFAHKLDTGAAASASLELTGTEAGAAGPFFTSYHNTATPANSDVPGALYIYGEDSGGGTQFWGGLSAQITDVTAASEDSTLITQVMSGGSQLAAMTLGGTPITSGAAPSAIFNLGTGTSSYPIIEVIQTDAAEGSPGLHFMHETASPAANDYAGFIGFYSRDSAANMQRYGEWGVNIIDATSTSEDSAAYFRTLVNGSAVDTLILGNGGEYRLYELASNGANYKALNPSDAIAANTTCTFEDDANFIPDSCVGDGSDASDGRLKTDLKPAGDVGALLDQIKIYDYAWTADAPEASEAVRKGKRGFGPVAQELFNVNSDFVEVGGDDPVKDPWTWKPERLVPYLIAEIQSLRKRVKELEAR
jgi:hypothetical protein